MLFEPYIPLTHLKFLLAGSSNFSGELTKWTTSSSDSFRASLASKFSIFISGLCADGICSLKNGVSSSCWSEMKWVKNGVFYVLLHLLKTSFLTHKMYLGTTWYSNLKEDVIKKLLDIFFRYIEQTSVKWTTSVERIVEWVSRYLKHDKANLICQVLLLNQFFFSIKQRELKEWKVMLNGYLDACSMIN